MSWRSGVTELLAANGRYHELHAAGLAGHEPALDGAGLLA